MKLAFENIPAGQDCFFNVFYHNHENPCQVFWHYHPECELVYVPFGSSRRQIGDHIGQYENGELVLIAPNIPHLNFNYQLLASHEEVVVQFRLDKLMNALQIFPEFSELALWLRGIKVATTFGATVRTELDHTIRSLQYLPPVERTLRFLNIINALSRTSDARSLDFPYRKVSYNLSEGERINKVYSYVAQNYHATLDMRHVVDLSGLSQPAFCRFFKKITKMSFTEFVNDFRIGKACQSLRRGETVAEAAFTNGFNSISHFSVTFAKRMNMSPSAYRLKVSREEKESEDLVLC